MLPQPRLRFLLADEPGTGKTIMAGLYLREMQRLGLVSRALVVAPAHLVTKWQADFERFFGGGLKRITADTAKDGPLRPDQDLWITSLDLAAVNPMVQEVIRPDRAGWGVVVFDEAHRLTPTAQGYYQVGRMLCYSSLRVLLMTATPHRGSEWLFRSLMHLVDPAVFPPSDKDDDLTHHVKPGRVHFIRRMKEELVDYDGVTPLFKGRRASNVAVPLNATEAAFYQQALELVDSYFPANSAALVRAENLVHGSDQLSCSPSVWP
jgi:superfamily II DNA or RNA helicase